MRERLSIFFDRMSFYNVCAMVFVAPFSNAAITSFFGFAFLFFLLKKVCRPDFSFVRSRMFMYLLVFYLFIAASLINSHELLLQSFRSFFFKWGECLLIFLVASDVVSSRRRVGILVAVVLSAGVMMALDGLYQGFFKVDFLRHREVLALREGLTASFKHPNSFGAYLVIVLLLAVAMVLYKHVRLWLWYCLLGLIGLLGACLIFTYSRGAWVGVLAGIGIMGVLIRKKRMYGAVILFVVVLLLVPMARQRFLEMFHPGGDADRFSLWRGAISMGMEHPFVGQGAGTFMNRMSAHGAGLVNTAQYAHNSYLQIFAETGIFSLLAFCLFLWELLWGAVRAFRKSNNYMVLGLLSGVVGFLVHSFFDNQFYSLSLAMFFWSLAGALYAGSLVELKEHHE